MISLAATGWLAYQTLSRTERVDNPALGLVTYQYRVGQLAVIRGDTDRDGRVDVRARLVDGLPVEMWEDSDFDGRFDRRVDLDGSEVRRIEIDRDGDGAFETILEGPAAQAFYAAQTGSD